MLDLELLKMLACSACAKPAPLTQKDEQTLVCDACGRSFAYGDGILTLFPDDEPVAKSESS